MSICYLCGRVMITQDDFKANQSLYGDKPPIEHEEHVIQNALYGRLMPADILCQPCGNELGKKVDTAFVKIFQSITERIPHILAAKTRNNGAVNRSIRGEVILKNKKKLSVTFKNGVIVPLHPKSFPPENGIVNVYAQKDTMTNFLLGIKKKLESEGHDPTSLAYNLISEITEYDTLGVNFKEGFTNFNEDLLHGYVKIATGFAAMHGVDRAQMTNTIDTKNNCMLFLDCVFPYISSSTFDKIYDPLSLF